MLYQDINTCRICNSKELTEVFNLGSQKLTGVFLENEKDLQSGPVSLVLCEKCSLLQMKQTYNSNIMYGDTYGYRTGLNNSMVMHVQQKYKFLEKKYLNSNSVIVDIGSNDSTGLKSYDRLTHKLVGIDPTARKFLQYYDSSTTVIPDFFSADKYFDIIDRSADLVTSLSMFYDLPDPIGFAKDVETILSDNGVWHLEQSYAPTMVRTLAYDTICQEHIEFYTLKSLLFIMNSANLKIIDLSFNNINGGSIALTVAKNNSKYTESELISPILDIENELGVNTNNYYLEFFENSREHARMIKRLLVQLKKSGKKIFGYGASTKGNVFLQFADIGSDLIDFIVEVNEDKFGKVTPGSKIPIISETEGERLKPDFYLVLPWHFKESIIIRSTDILNRGAKFIFPNPTIEIYGR